MRVGDEPDDRGAFSHSPDPSGVCCRPAACTELMLPVSRIFIHVLHLLWVKRSGGPEVLRLLWESGARNCPGVTHGLASRPAREVARDVVDRIFRHSSVA